MRSQRIQSALGLLARPLATPSVTIPGLGAQARWAHSHAPRPVPAPTPFVPDVETFLTVIGRGLKQHASKFPTWEALFTLNSDQLRELGVEPPRTRRYLLRWRERFRLGKFGIGGDLKHVENGMAELKVRETHKTPLVRLRQVVNVPPGQEESTPEAVLVSGFKVKGVGTISGSYALPMRHGGARVTVTEGMWEDKRGHKVDGGERRREEVRFKRRVAERKALREQQGYY
ncbi:IGR protein motif-domain-containing protein [Staphylotrichum tortipilum]|uniref:Small ribosomal subunit protein mS41 n=1 Tax=Staphylotrichum tortipilum TaxID=2831512 RepID=A0AAN6MTZ6_9PEZI|nr:IGR protein motif-domain-containing protein [Staphylotrichum longicolle]